MAEVVKGDRKVSYWQVFLDDIHLIFFLGIAVFFISYTVWGLAEISTVGQSTIGEVAQPEAAGAVAPAADVVAPVAGAVEQPPAAK